MRDVFSLERDTQILADDSYIISYPYMLEYFAPKSSFDEGDVVRGAHMAYGWMQTILEMYPEPGENDLRMAAQVLNDAKAGNDLSTEKIDALASLVNNSVVGASKLLHFVAPQHFAIWDSRVYCYVHEKRPYHYRVNNARTYLDYVRVLKELAQEPEFAIFHASVQEKLGYDVSPLRALELVMFLNAPRYGG